MSCELSEDELKLQQPEFASMLEIIQSSERCLRTAIDVIGEFPDRFGDPDLRAEAQLVTRQVLRDFADQIRELVDARALRRRQ